MDTLLNIDYSLCATIDTEILLKLNILPIKKETLFLVVACSDNDHDIAKLTELFNFPVKLTLVSKEQLIRELNSLSRNKKLYSLAQFAIKHETKENQKNPNITNFLDYVLQECVINSISDIHIELMENITILRVRINGVLENFFSFEKKLFFLLSSTIKLLGNLDISQKRLPLNSRFSRKLHTKEYDFRISTLPTIYGESIVLRVLDNHNIKKRLDQIGFKNNTLQTIKNTLKSNQGLILVTGPTGSGKTTTLYSMLDLLNTPEKKIITIEDPVEYKLNGVIQVNINQDIKLDFLTVLKNILRQDPDILMIGEIRDKESLDIALRASLTGHLVIATLHTNNTIETITRLLDLNAPPYLISATVKLIIAQRLVRTLCNNCKSYDPHLQSYINKGCKICNSKGFDSRTVVEEYLVFDETIQKLINNSCDLEKIIKYIQTKGFKTLKQNGLELVTQGVTSMKELESKI